MGAYKNQGGPFLNEGALRDRLEENGKTLEEAEDEYFKDEEVFED